MSRGAAGFLVVRGEGVDGRAGMKMTDESKDCMPRLRFPEFRQADDWDYISGGDVFSNAVEKNSQNLPLPILAITQENGAIPRDEINYSVIVSDESIKNYKIVKKGDFIISLRTFQGGIEYSSFDGLCSPAYILLRKKKGINYYDSFFIYYFKEYSFIQSLNKDLMGIRDGKIIPYSHFAKINLPFPPLKEQQKIADCLSSLDELIEAHEQKRDALVEHKKGLMQRLFPAEGETTPRWRFPEFRKAPKWKKEKLGKLLIGRPEYGVNAPAVPYSPDLPTYIRITDISDAGTFIKDKKMSVDIDPNPNFYLQLGDIVFARTGASVGKSYKFRQEDGQLVFAGFLIRVRPDSNKLNSDYLFHYLSTSQYWKWVRFMSMRSGQPGINGAEYASLTLPMCSLPEQQKIADCLSSLDARIEAEEAEIAALREQKQGLMQQLFPQSL